LKVYEKRMPYTVDVKDIVPNTMTRTVKKEPEKEPENPPLS
jgi:hypothetical protein